MAAAGGHAWGRELLASAAPVAMTTTVSSRPDTGLLWHGKSYAELAPIERHELKQRDAARHERMRNAWVSEQQPKPRAVPQRLVIDGKAYEQLSNFERHRLRVRDPEAFDRLRANALERGAL
jgi:hypothetical protein